MTFQVKAPDKLIKMIRKDEGFRGRPYTDSEGLLTIGIGFCIDRAPLPETVGLYWCGYILDNIQNRISTSQFAGQTFNRLSEPRQWAILNMCYQMGVTGVCRFFNMWAALDVEDYGKAAKEALDSVWAHQTPKRAKRISEIIRTGKITGYGI